MPLGRDLALLSALLSALLLALSFMSTTARKGVLYKWTSLPIQISFDFCPDRLATVNNEESTHEEGSGCSWRHSDTASA